MSKSNDSLYHPLAIALAVFLLSCAVLFAAAGSLAWSGLVDHRGAAAACAAARAWLAAAGPAGRAALLAGTGCVSCGALVATITRARSRRVNIAGSLVLAGFNLALAFMAFATPGAGAC